MTELKQMCSLAILFFSGVLFILVVEMVKSSEEERAKIVKQIVINLFFLFCASGFILYF